MRETAERIEDPRLCGLFIRSQFESLPADWCRERFGRPYPPASVVFGSGSWERYRRYIDSGVVSG